MADNFFARVGQLQAELKAPKGQTNNYGGYKYRSCEDILEAVKPLMLQYKMILTVGDEIIQIGTRYYVKATAVLRDIETAESITNSAYAREAETKKGMDESQISGTASSYARKYALNGLFCIDDTKDADTNEFANRTRNTQDKATSEPSMCFDCRKPIVNARKRDGAEWSASDIVSYSIKRFGRCLCPDCQRKAFQAEKDTGK